MADFDALFVALDIEAVQLNERYLKRFIPVDPQHTPADFEYDVKAFSILSHAAFEEYVEAVSEAMMLKIENDLLQNKITLATACLLSTYGVKLLFLDNENDTEKSCFDRVRVVIADAKKIHSKILKDNHGVSVRYLRKLLIPVGIDMPTGPGMASLKKLADARGSFAHTMAKLAQYGDYKKANKILIPIA